MESKIFLDREKLAWAAGFFDGEGNVVLNRHNGRTSTYLCLSIAQVCSDKEWIFEPYSEVLERFQNAVLGLGSITGPYGSSNQREYLKYSVNNFEHVQIVMCLLWPWLGSTKRDSFTKQVQEYHKHPRYKGIYQRG